MRVDLVRVDFVRVDLVGLTHLNTSPWLLGLMHNICNNNITSTIQMFLLGPSYFWMMEVEL